MNEGDSQNIVYLIKNGTKITMGKVIAWFPKDSLSSERMHEIADMLNIGISKSEKFIGAPFSWQKLPPDAAYTFFFRFDRFISHASLAGFVSIPFWRIKNGMAPWLHEAIHEILNSKNGNWASVSDDIAYKYLPLWLSEGLPDYISLKVSVMEQLLWFDVFSNSSQTNLDSLFVNEVRSENGKYILSFIGAEGILPELFSEKRSLYAPAFYHGSFSFVKFLAENYGIGILLSAVSSFREEVSTIERLTGKRLADLKNEWLDKMNIEKNE